MNFLRKKRNYLIVREIIFDEYFVVEIFINCFNIHKV